MPLRTTTSVAPIELLGLARRAAQRQRLHAAAFRNEWQSAWLEGIEGAFRFFGGLPGELLLDNSRALVKHHNATTREVEFNDRLHVFARYWNVRPIACVPYRPRTKGTHERGVGHVKNNAVAGRRFASWGALETHLAWWMREVPDVRVHGTTGEAPIARFEREQQQALRPLNGRPPFHQLRELTRRLQNDACVDIDTNHYSVPWKLIGAEVTVQVGGGEIRQFAAWLGLTPLQSSSGGKERLGRISKMGDKYLRRLLVIGATALVQYAKSKPETAHPHLVNLLARKPMRVTSVAMANKMARIIWAVMTRGKVYQADHIPALSA